MKRGPALQWTRVRPIPSIYGYMQAYTEQVLLKYGKLATKHSWIWPTDIFGSVANEDNIELAQCTANG